MICRRRHESCQVSYSIKNRILQFQKFKKGMENAWVSSYFPPCVRIVGNFQRPNSNNNYNTSSFLPEKGHFSFTFPSLSWMNAEWLKLKLLLGCSSCVCCENLKLSATTLAKERTESAYRSFSSTVTSKKREREKGKADFRLSFQVEWIDLYHHRARYNNVPPVPVPYITLPPSLRVVEFENTASS